jgi:hypothetical protein
MKFYTSIGLVLEDIRQDIIDQYEAKNIKASGAFERNMKVERRARGKFVLSIPYYSRWISLLDGRKPGRAPGNYPPTDKIKQWIKDKGLQLRDFETGQFLSKTETNYSKAAYLISRKIAEQGTDIYKGKRKPIDIDQIIDNRLDYRGDHLADRIMEDIRI